MIEHIGVIDDRYIIHAENESWDEETINELMTYDIFYSPNSVRAIMVKDNICYIGHEDDGYITFDMKYGRLSDGFHIDWIDSFVDILQKTKRVMKNKTITKNRYIISVLMRHRDNPKWFTSKTTAPRYIEYDNSCVKYGKPDLMSSIYQDIKYLEETDNETVRSNQELRTVVIKVVDNSIPKIKDWQDDSAVLYYYRDVISAHLADYEDACKHIIGRETTTMTLEEIINTFND